MNIEIEMLVKSKYNGASVPVGEILTLDKATANQLITEGSARPTQVAVEDDVVAGATNEENEITPTGGEVTGQEQVAAASDTDDAVTKIKKALDNQYKKEELVEAAKAVGVEFAFDATKPVIIDAVVAQGKAEALLK